MKFELTQDDMTSLTSEQKVAIMESLLIAVLADGKAERAEVERFDHEVDHIAWGIDRPELAAQMAAARTRVLQLKGDQAVLQFIGGVAARLPSADLREKVFRAMCAIMYANKDLNAGEKNVIVAFATAFRIPVERLDLIKAAIVG